MSNTPQSPIEQIVDGLLTLACARKPPVVDLATEMSDDDVTIVRDSRSALASQEEEGSDDIQIVSAVVAINVDDDDSPGDPSKPIVAPPVIDVEDVELPQGVSVDPEVALAQIEEKQDDVVECLTTARRPRLGPAKCNACSTILRSPPAVIISRCKHSLCALCGLRSIAQTSKVDPNEKDQKKVPRASNLRFVPICPVSRCRAPLNPYEADLALAVPESDEAFADALAVFHTWREAELGPDDVGLAAARFIEFPGVSSECTAMVVAGGVIEGRDVLLTDDVATACEPLWALDEEEEDDELWICAACGLYDVSSKSRKKLGGEKAETADMHAASFSPYPHCVHARALGAYENVMGLSRVWEDEKEAEARRKAKEQAAAKRKSTKKRYRSAVSLRIAKRRKVANKGGFAKGTGYAGSSGSEWKGTSEKLLEETARRDAEATYWLIRIRCFLLRPADGSTLSWPGYMRALLRESKLVVHLSKILINESIMEVVGRIPVFYAALRVVHALTEAPSLRLLVIEPIDGDKGRCIAELVESLSQQAALLSTGAGPEGLPETTKFLIKQIRKCIRSINRHNLLQIVRNRNAAECTVDVDSPEQEVMNVSDLDGSGNSDKCNSKTDDDEHGSDGSPSVSFDADKAVYIEKMRAHQFQAVAGLAKSSSFYDEAIRAERYGTPPGKRQRRIASEVASLFSSLPLSWSSTILLRVDEDRYDFLRACIFGPEETPYDSGAFIFDIYLPHSYPDVPPKFKLLTTGGGRVRFNPNLYNNGKVCLSLLGTWSGPSWTSASTILQVLVSIQSLILCPDPYFNEPGFEKTLGTESGKRSSALYNVRVRLDTALYAIHQNMRHPTSELAAGILTHFKLKRRFLVYSLRKWFKNAAKESGTSTGTSTGASTDSEKPMASHSTSSAAVSADPTSPIGSQEEAVAAANLGSSGSKLAAKMASLFNAFSSFGSGRNFRNPEMSRTNLEKIISDLEAIP